MKRILVLTLVVLMLTGFITGCAQKADTGSSGQTTSGVSSDSNAVQTTTGASNTAIGDKVDYSGKKVVLLIPGNLGDQSFFDLTAGCVPMIKDAYNIDVKVVEMGTDSSTWYTAIADYCELKYDLILSLTGADEQINKAAKAYPDQKFINVCSGSTENLSNVYNVTMRANEMALFGGAAAALKAKELGENTIGFVGGIDVPGINYFLVGYIEGAKWVNPDIKVVPSYVGSFTDPSKAKENALLLYNSGISVIFGCAGGSGLGVMDAAAQLGKYTIGVDTDQYQTLLKNSPKLANTIITSCIQLIPATTTRLVGEYFSGKAIKWNSHDYLGFGDNAVGISKNDNYKKLLSDASRTKLEELEKAFKNGELKNTSTVKNDGTMMTAEEIAPIINAVRPQK